MRLLGLSVLLLFFLFFAFALRYPQADHQIGIRVLGSGFTAPRTTMALMLFLVNAQGERVHASFNAKFCFDTLKCQRFEAQDEMMVHLETPDLLPAILHISTTYAKHTENIHLNIESVQQAKPVEAISMQKNDSITSQAENGFIVAGLKSRLWLLSKNSLKACGHFPVMNHDSLWKYTDLIIPPNTSWIDCTNENNQKSKIKILEKSSGMQFDTEQNIIHTLGSVKQLYLAHTHVHGIQKIERIACQKHQCFFSHDANDSIYAFKDLTLENYGIWKRPSIPIACSDLKQCQLMPQNYENIRILYDTSQAQWQQVLHAYQQRKHLSMYGVGVLASIMIGYAILQLIHMRKKKISMPYASWAIVVILISMLVGLLYVIQSWH